MGDNKKTILRRQKQLILDRAELPLKVILKGTTKEYVIKATKPGGLIMN